MNEEQLMQQIADSLSPDTSPSPIPQPGVKALEVMQIGPESSPVKMDDDELQSILDNYIVGAQNWVGSEISIEQARAMEYYLGEAVGDLAPPEVADRSEIVDTVVSDQIEWLMPALMEIMYASGNPVKFTPRKPGDEDGADQMTALVNYVMNEQNRGFEVMSAWYKTALLSKVGVVKVWWDEELERTQERYSGLTDAQFAIITDDPEVTVSEVTSYTDPNAERAAMAQFQQAQAAFPQMQQQYQMMQAKAAQHPQIPTSQVPQGMPGSMPPQAPPGAPPLPPPPQQPVAPDISKLPMLHDVVVTRSKKDGHVCVDALNPEDFLIAPTSKRIEDGFCAHRMKRTMSQLRAKGYDLSKYDDIEDISSDNNAEQIDNSELYLARHALEDIFSTPENDQDSMGDESQRTVWLYECYLPIDCDGDGIAEWRKITKAGNMILENEVCDGPPFASLCPVPIPGLFYGRSIADLAIPIQRIKTGLLRSMIDNVNMQVNGRTWAVENQVNMEDLLTNRPGGIVRVKNGQAVGSLVQGMGDGAGAYQLLQYVDTMSQERTGITKYSQGLDSDTLNHTASGIENITQRADLRVKLIARTFAETGMKTLFKLVQKVLAAYQDQRMTFQISGKWVDVDPRVWRNQYAMAVTVGTGTGDMGRRVGQLTQLAAVQQQGMAIGIATPQNIYHTAGELVKSLQLGEPSQFFTEPPPPPPPGTPPPPNPQMQMAQAQLASQEKIEQMKAQLQQQTDIAKIQAQTQQANQEAQAKAALEQQHQQLIDQRERDIQVQNVAWEREKLYATLAVQREAAALKAGADTATEESMNDSIQQDQLQDQGADIDAEHALAQQLLNS